MSLRRCWCRASRVCRAVTLGTSGCGRRGSCMCGLNRSSPSIPRAPARHTVRANAVCSPPYSRTRWMMRVPWFDRLLVGAAAVACVVLVASPLPAQQGAVITGRVTSEQGEPLGGASVVIANTHLGAATTANGNYTLTIAAEAARGQQVVVTARYIGYKAATRTITLGPGAQEQSFQLHLDPFRLEEVVVTGVSDATEAKKVPFDVGTVNIDQLKEVPGASARRGRGQQHAAADGVLALARVGDLRHHARRAVRPHRQLRADGDGWPENRVEPDRRQSVPHVPRLLG